MVTPFPDGLQNKIGGGEIHVGDPHGQQVGGAEFFAESVVFVTVAVATVDGSVKIRVGRHISRADTCI